MVFGPSTIRYRIVAWLTLLTALSYFCRNSVGVAESGIRSDLGLTEVQSGWFMSSFYWSYALCQVPSALIGQRYGTRIALTIFAIVWSVACFAIGIAPGLWLLITAQLMMGVAQAGVVPLNGNSVGHWMPLSQRSLACGFVSAGMQAGAIATSMLTGVLLVRLGWRWVFIVYAFPGIIAAVWFFLRFRDRPEQDVRVTESELALIQAGRETSDKTKPIAPPTEKAAWLALARSPVVWLICGQQICRASGYIFFASWFPTFLQKTRDVSVSNSGYLQGMVLTGTLAGSIFGGMLSDWIWRRTRNLRISRSVVGASSMGTCAMLILVSWFVQNVPLAVTLLTLGAFFAALAGPAATAATIDIGGQRVPQVLGLMNMCGNLAAALTLVLVGMIFEWTANWNLVLLLFAGVYFTGAVCWVLLNPKKHLA